MVIADVALSVSHAVFVYKISNCAGQSVLFRVAAKRMDDDGSAVVGRSRLQHHFRCTSSIEIDEHSLAG